MADLPTTFVNPSDYIGLGQAARLIPGNPSANCVWRWCRKGVKSRDGTRIHLQHARWGAKVMTRPEWVMAFGAALAAADQKFFTARDSAGENLPARDPSFATNGRKAQRAARIAARRSAASKSVNDAYRDLEVEGI